LEYSCQPISNVVSEKRFGIEKDTFLCIDKEVISAVGIVQCATDYCMTQPVQSCVQLVPTSTAAGRIGKEAQTQNCLEKDFFTDKGILQCLFSEFYGYS